MVAHLLADDIYLDVKLASWAQMTGGGGGFSYVRSSPPTPLVNAKQVPLLPVPTRVALAFGLAALGLGLWRGRRARFNDEINAAAAPASPDRTPV